MLHIKNSMAAQMAAVNPEIHRFPRSKWMLGIRRLADSPRPNGTATSIFSRVLGRLEILEAVSLPPLDRETTAGLDEVL
jgi:signal-transduction protein with cAMP-binding, CBS, and nucleotidyltransferase domain